MLLAETTLLSQVTWPTVTIGPTAAPVTYSSVTNALSLTGSTNTFVRSDGSQSVASGESSNWNAVGSTNSSILGTFTSNSGTLTNGVTLGTNTITPLNGGPLLVNTNSLLAPHPVWTRIGQVLNPSGPSDSSQIMEPFVLFEPNPQLTWTATPTNVFKMWYSTGLGSGIKYAESLDGAAWSRYSTNSSFVLSGAFGGSCVVHDSTNYYLFVYHSSIAIDVYLSTNGIAWSTLETNIITKGSAGAWDSGSIFNPHIIKESANSWKMWYEGTKVGVGAGIGYATSTDGVSWTKSGSNPIIGGNGTIQPGGPLVLKSGSTYYMWMHYNENGLPTVLPTDIARYHSSDGIAWTRDCLTFSRRTGDEGYDTAKGQVADPMLLPVGGKMFMYYTGLDDGSAVKLGVIKLAIANLSLSDLVSTQEGESNADLHQSVSGDFLPSDPYARIGTTTKPWAAGYMSGGFTAGALNTAIGGDVTTQGPYLTGSTTKNMVLYHQNGSDSGRLVFAGTTGGLTGQYTASVGNTATAILPSDYGFGGLAIVRGDSGSDQFIDLVFFGSADAAVISSRTAGSPVARTYTVGASSQLKLSMASGTYNIRAGVFAE